MKLKSVLSIFPATIISSAIPYSVTVFSLCLLHHFPPLYEYSTQIISSNKTIYTKFCIVLKITYQLLQAFPLYSCCPAKPASPFSSSVWIFNSNYIKKQNNLYQVLHFGQNYLPASSSVPTIQPLSCKTSKRFITIDQLNSLCLNH